MAKTKLTPELVDKIIKFVETGNFTKTACLGVGIDEKTFYNWRRRAETKEEPFFSFFKSLKEAANKAELLHVTNITAQSRGNAKWSAWFLERKYSNRWGRKDTYNLKHEGQIDSNSKLDLDGFTTEDLKLLAAELKKEIQEEEEAKKRTLNKEVG